MVRLVAQTEHSVVYLVRHRQLSVYRIAKLVAKSNADYERILREADIIKNLKHTCIPLVYDVEEDSDSICIIEEYISGNSLAEYIANNEISVHQIVLLSIKICEALEYLHEEAGVMHLDLKPSNIMVRGFCADEYDVCLIDFDSSALLAEAAEHQKTEGAACRIENTGVKPYGTVGFAAPEQYCAAGRQLGFPEDAQESPQELTQRSDIYSMGMLLLYMLSELHVRSVTKRTKRSLFCGAKKIPEVSGAGRELRETEAETLCELYSDTVGPVIQKCIRHHPRQRYESVKELKKELETVISKKAKKQIVNTEKACDIYVRGTKNGVGTTHFCLCLASFLQRAFAKERVLYICQSDLQDVRTETCKGKLDKGGAYIRHGLHLIPDCVQGITCDLSPYTVIVHDCGTTDICGIKEDEGKEKSLEIVVAQGGYRKDAWLFLKELREREIVFVNHISGKAFYELVKQCEETGHGGLQGKTRFFRMPCMYEWHKHNKLFEEAVIEALKERQIFTRQIDKNRRYGRRQR